MIRCVRTLVSSRAQAGHVPSILATLLAIGLGATISTSLETGVTGSCQAEEPAAGRSPETVDAHLKTSDGLAATLFAAEPLVRQPILVKFDPRGRLWTIQYLQYPNPAGLTRKQVDRYSRTVYDRVPEPPPLGPRGDDRLSLVLDHDGDGRADEVRDAVQGLNLATGLEFGYGGWYVLQVPYLLFYADRNQDDVPDGDPRVLLSGFGMEDAQSLVNHLTWGPDGWLYGVTGSTSTNRVRDIEFQQAVWRYHPRSEEFELFAEGGGNLFGMTFDAYGRMFFSSNSGQVAYHGLQGAYYEKSFAKHGALHNVHAYGWFREIDKKSPQMGPTTGGTIYLADAFPPRYRGAFMAGDFLGHTVSWWDISPLGTTYSMRRGGVMLDPLDRWSGPTDVCLAPDGSVYVSDFYDARTAHPDPDAPWDRSNGRIYRIHAATSNDHATRCNLPDLSSEELVDLLCHPNHWYRQRARVLLAERQDAGTWPRLRAMALRSDDVLLALQGVWALQASGGWNDAIALELMGHPSAEMRGWSVRFVGDRREASAEVAERLRQLARSETHAEVRQQLASTAGRLPGPQAIQILDALATSSPGDTEGRLSWLLWWSLERHAVAQRDELLSTWSDVAHWEHELTRDQLLRLLRRYAAEGTAAAYDACARLADSAPTSRLPDVLLAVDRGLAEQGATVAQPGEGSLFVGSAHRIDNRPASHRPREAVRGPLAAWIAERWRQQPTDDIVLSLALRCGLAGAVEAARARIEDQRLPLEARVQACELLARLQPIACRELLPLLDDTAPDALRAALVQAIAPLGEQIPSLADRLLAESLAVNDSAARRAARAAMLRRAPTALRLLEQVDGKRLGAAEISLEDLRLVSLHEDPSIEAIVARHWGTVRAGTPEEKLATMRRYSNDVRAAAGDAIAGRVLFRQHCGTCHQLYGEGGRVGPDLTTANRTDREFLLASLVDPGSVIRAPYQGFQALTRDGRIFQGVIQEQDAAQVTLLDAKASPQRIAREDLESLEPMANSVMPEGLLEKLTPQELRDLFAYLESKEPLPQ